MAEGPVPISIPVLFCDSFMVTPSPFGALLRFQVRSFVQESGKAPMVALTELARFGLSMEHLKLMATMLVRTILGYEQSVKHPVMVPEEVLQSLNIPLADWNRFWSGGDVTPVAPSPIPSGAGAIMPR